MDLLTAVKLHTLDEVKKSIKKHGIPFDTEWIDYESLNVALTYGKRDVALFLLDQHCRVNKTKMSLVPMLVQDSTPLHNAVKLGDEQIIKRLLKKKASILTLDSDNNSPLHLALITKQETIIDLLLENIQQTSNYINLKNEYGLSHLHIACTRNNIQVIQGFLDKNREANIEDKVNENSPYWAGFAAIHFAVSFKSLEALTFLLNLNANQIKTSTGETPLELAYRNIEEWMIMIDLLQANNSYCTTNRKLSFFHLACVNEDREVVENFVNHGAAVNSSTPWDLSISPLSSPLHCAVISKDKEKVKFLLEQGATVDCINSDRMTPLHLALYNETFLHKDTGEIVDMLHENANTKILNKVDRYGLSYFHVAITRNDVAIVKAYLDGGQIDVNQPLSAHAKAFSNFTPLHLAVWYQYPDIVNLLVEYGADVNANNNNSVGTPLHMAFEAGDIDFIELFLNNRARVDLVVVNKNKTMLHLLVVHCFYEVKSRRGDFLLGNEPEILLYIEHLVKLGIDVNARDATGNTALHFVNPSREGCAKYFQLLLDLGADINLENCSGRVPFTLDEQQTDDRYNSKEYEIFYDHVQKLKNLGLIIHPKNEESCQKIFENGKFNQEELAAKEQQQLDEIAKLKDVKLDIITTLFDFLKLEPMRAALFANCKALKMIAEDSDLMDVYPLYGCFIRSQYQMSKLANEKLSRTDNNEEAVRKRQRCV